jgi:Chloroplast import apparatus Tic20-like
MTWHGRTGIKDKILASLTYLFPLVEVLRFGIFLFIQLPPLKLLFIPLYPALFIYNSIDAPFMAIFRFRVASILIFFALYLLVVRNEKLIHFLRFNAMQALMLAIFAYLCGTILELMNILHVPTGFDVLLSSGQLETKAPILLVVLVNAIFLTVVAACIYSIVQVLRGLYAEIPVISEAAYAQTR